MRKIIFGIFILAYGVTSLDCQAKLKKNLQQPQEIRSLCKKAQDLERDISRALGEIETINQKEKIFAPIIRNKFEILARCYTILVDIQRFSDLLVLTQKDDKNDFVRCSIIVKNFYPYFKGISSQLGKNKVEVSLLRKNKQQYLAELAEKKAVYETLCAEINSKTAELAMARQENIIQDDIVYHIASKSESIEELDAELEAENTIGVLRNIKISTELALVYPVVGKIIAEFGDKSPNNEMIYHISFSTSPAAVVTSPVKGLVVFTGKFLNYGNMIIISNGEYRIFLYGMDLLFTSTGDIVEIGDYVGRMGTISRDGFVIKMELKKSGEPLDPRHWLLETLEKGKS
ncbi:MAG: peptidoglycan DD-metalloendopeptidase family protein [Holosporaceae bacterium]|jgi:septal ring factor EnvC (AmiA/AmiB activator)|nr:peptidoglycan DD-metalloendopeptidase family protein [Holosporaceae bacterium]